MLPIIVLAVDSDCLDQQVVLFCSPGPANNFFRHGIWNREEDENTERKNLDSAALIPCFLLDRLKLSRQLVRHCSRPAMSLVQEYSSGEDEGPVSPTHDAFGLASLPATKKPRVETPEPMSIIPHSAPDVLSEVRNVSNPS